MADVQSKAQATTTSQISTALANANKVMEEAAKREDKTTQKSCTERPKKEQGG